MCQWQFSEFPHPIRCKISNICKVQLTEGVDPSNGPKMCKWQFSEFTQTSRCNIRIQNAQLTEGGDLSTLFILFLINISFLQNYFRTREYLEFFVYNYLNSYFQEKVISPNYYLNNISFFIWFGDLLKNMHYHFKNLAKFLQSCLCASQPLTWHSLEQ